MIAEIVGTDMRGPPPVMSVSIGMYRRKGGTWAELNFLTDMIGNRKRIVVMGGSFNPPTLAHYRLMETAIEALGADLGFFVPVGNAYLRRKMRRSNPPVVLSAELRVRMLDAICSDKRMAVYSEALDAVRPNTVPTLMAIQEEYPSAELYFLMGADKLDLLVNLIKSYDFLNKFRAVIFSRDQGAVEETLNGDDVLSLFLDRIYVLPQPYGTEKISSSMVRELMLARKPYCHMLCPAVCELLSEVNPEDFPEVIDKFVDEYDFLSNRFSCRFMWEGLEYGNAEAALQASKCVDMSIRKVFYALSADRVAARGGFIVPYEGWEAARPAIMKSILNAKFGQNPVLMRKLTDTGKRVLINGNNRHDTYWGVDLYSWQGENRLGKILMDIRDEAWRFR